VRQNLLVVGEGGAGAVGGNRPAVAAFEIAGQARLKDASVGVGEGLLGDEAQLIRLDVAEPPPAQRRVARRCGRCTSSACAVTPGPSRRHDAANGSAFGTVAASTVRRCWPTC